MSGHRIFPYRFLHGGRLKKSNCLPTNAVFKTNIPLEGNMSFCRGMISHEGGRGNRNTTQILSSYSTYAAPFHMALLQHNFIRRFCSTQTLMWIIASIEFLTGKGQDFGQTWTPRSPCKRDFAMMGGNRHKETAQRAPSNSKNTWPEN